MTDQPTIKYPYLPSDRTILFVSLDNPFMQLAKKICEERSTDTNHGTGAVVVKDGRVIGEWANQSALHNPKLIKLHKNGWCLRKILKIKTGTNYWLCPGCASAKHHSETGSVRDAIKKGNNPAGADLYLYGHWWCCEPCWNYMIKHGIKNVYLLENSHTIFTRETRLKNIDKIS